MGNGLAAIVCFGAHLVDGNQLTNLLSIGPADRRTGPAAINTKATGLNTHGVFGMSCIWNDGNQLFDSFLEGDASMTRGDFQFGDNFK